MNRHEIGRQTEIAATLLARDYKGLSNHQMTTAIVETGGADGIYVNVTTAFNRGGLPGVARTVKTDDSGGVVLYD